MYSHTHTNFVNRLFFFHLIAYKDLLREDKLKQIDRFVTVNYNIYIVDGPTHVGGDHATHACGPITFAQKIITTNNL